MRIKKTMGLDLGSKTCGVALSDGLGMFAHPYETLRFEGDLESLKPLLQRIIEKENVTAIALGFPKMMNNDVGERAQISQEFKSRLEKWFEVSVVLIDERLTTASATRNLIAQDVSRAKRKKIVDQVAAVEILQTYLDQRKYEN